MLCLYEDNKLYMCEISIDSDFAEVLIVSVSFLLNSIIFVSRYYFTINLLDFVFKN